MPIRTTAVDARADRAEKLLANRYRLRHRIGSGRFGPVYSAVDTTRADTAPGNGVAVQLLWSELGKHKWLVDRFKTDFIRLRSWRHDNIVRALDFGQYGDRFYWVTSLLDGASLRSISQQLEPELVEEGEAHAVIGAVGEALQYAHAREKVHGDIRFENIFITSDLVVKVLDFVPLPIAHSAHIIADDLKSHALTGTDCRNDVFGLACVAYELLSGQHPYGGSLPEEVRRCGLKLERIDGLSRRMWKALRRALEPVPEKRTSTVRQFMSEFGGAARLAPAEPPREQPVQPRAARTILRRVSWTAALASVVGIAYLGYPVFPSIPRGADLWTQAKDRIEGIWPAGSRAPDEFLAAEPSDSADGAATRTAISHAPALVAVPPAAATDEDQKVTSADPVSAQDSPPATNYSADAGGDNSTVAHTVADELVQTVTPRSGESQLLIAFPAVEPTPAPVPNDFEFAETRVAVSERSAVAALAIQRLGEPRGEITVSWWTLEETAVADEDYANFGTLMETFGDGERTRTIYIPLVVDTVAESTERFYVRLGYDSRQDGRQERQAEVVIVDDDS